jgi:hypothetical protein
MIVRHVLEVSERNLGSYYMLNASLVIVPAENSDGLCRIGPKAGHQVHKLSDQ